tara:strand:+ start:19114 stop:19329 length:216 start_codon:yes stop_codon:yes gene_type:complete
MLKITYWVEESSLIINQKDKYYPFGDVSNKEEILYIIDNLHLFAFYNEESVILNKIKTLQFLTLNEWLLLN